MFRILNKLNDLFIIKNNVNLSIALSLTRGKDGKIPYSRISMFGNVCVEINKINGINFL
jgi:hypothetical protein